MQLVAYGAQDIYLTGNPQITFFKVVYRRHTNFSMEAIAQTFNGTSDFGKNVSATISRNGDLVYRMYLEHTVEFKSNGSSLKEYLNITSNYGSNLIKECELEIGGQKIDRHYNHWHSVYSQLVEKNPDGSFDNGSNEQSISDNTIKRSTLFNTMSGNGGPVSTGLSTDNVVGLKTGSWNSIITSSNDDTNRDISNTNIYIPLYFWFCRNPGLALPLIALQYHEVKVKMTFEKYQNLVKNVNEGDVDDNLMSNSNTLSLSYTDLDSSNVGNKKFTLWCDYIYLDTDERRRFAQVSHEYLIEQLQFQEFSNTKNMNLNFNHPVKELIWTSSHNILDDSISSISPINYSFPQTWDEDDAKNNAILREPQSLDDDNTYQLKLNGHDRFKERSSTYFTRTQIWEHHTGYGSTVNKDAIAVYSFALKPEEHQPSGTCNFSRIDNAQLVVGGSSPYLNHNVYAVNYNVLRIMSGMGGLAYSN